MHPIRCVTSSLRAVVVAVGLLPFVAWQAWTGVTAAWDNGEDGNDADAAPGIGHPRNGPISGSGTPAVRHVAAPGVTVLLVDASFLVHVRLGEPEQAVIRCDDNLVDLVEARIDGNQLRLGLRPRLQVRAATLYAEVTIRYLEQITAGGASRVRLDSKLVGEGLVLSVLGMSEICGPIRIERVQVGMSGASRLELSGEVRRLGVAASGACELMLAGLAVAELDARLAGASTAEVTVRDTLTVQASGASSLRYHGSPRTVRRQSTGASSVGPLR